MQLSSRQKFFNFSLTRIILGLIFCFIVFIISQKLISSLLDLTSLNKDFRNLIKGLFASAAVIFAYIFFYARIEKRTITEFSGKQLFKNILIGCSIGVVLQILTILMIALFGKFNILSINPFSFMVIPFTVAFSVAIFEEILIRGIIFRITEEKLGTYISLLISAMIFGGMHLLTPDSTLISGLSTGMAGLLLGIAYIYRRNLWFPIAIHFSWNFMQSGIFGAITSGNEKTNSLLNTEIIGNQLITGGKFGPEASIQAIVLLLISSIILWSLNSKNNNLIKPYWKK